MTRVLIVEGDDHLAAGLTFNLEAEGYIAQVKANGHAALDTLTASHRFDLVLLDLMLSGMDGFDVIRHLRAASVIVPVTVLTARGHTDDVLRAFRVGADDYLPKPFDLSLLFARIRAVLLHKAWLQGRRVDGRPEAPDEVGVAGGHVNFSRQVLERDGAEQSVTLMEATLLRYLVGQDGCAVAQTELLTALWGERQDTDPRIVGYIVARLRRLLEDNPSAPRYLRTVRGGYRFTAEPTRPT